MLTLDFYVTMLCCAAEIESALEHRNTYIYTYVGNNKYTNFGNISVLLC